MHVAKEHNVEPEIMVQFALALRDLLEILQLHVVQTETVDSAANVVAAMLANVVAAMLLEPHDTDDLLMTTSNHSSRIKTIFINRTYIPFTDHAIILCLYQF